MVPSLRQDISVHYARQVLQRWWQVWQEVTPEPCQQMADLYYRLQQDILQVAVVGLVGRGKSSLLNALLGKPVFATGPTHGTTQTIQSVTWLTGIPLTSQGGPAQGSVVLVDTPGLDEVEGAARTHLALEVARQVELIVFVTAGDLTRPEAEALGELRQAGKPIVLVLNKADLYPELDRQAIYDTLVQERVKDILSPTDIVMVAAAPRQLQPVCLPNGQVQGEIKIGDPQVEPLRQKILEVLQREGKLLLALNALTTAQRWQLQITEQHRQWFRGAGQVLMAEMMVAKAVLVALCPWSLGDVLLGLAVDVALLLGLSRVYHLPLAGSLLLLQTLLTSGVMVAISQGWQEGLWGSLLQGGWAAWATYRVGRVGERLLGHEGSLGEALAQVREDLPLDSVAAKVYWKWTGQE
ncbi:MAG: Era-like GTP-binding protein [Thermostichales cyanobacterium DRC_bins_46]